MKSYRDEDGRLHRVNGPAVKNTDGDYSWCYDGEVHRYYGVAWKVDVNYEYWIFGEEIR